MEDRHGTSVDGLADDRAGGDDGPRGDGLSGVAVEDRSLARLMPRLRPAGLPVSLECQAARHRRTSPTGQPLGCLGDWIEGNDRFVRCTCACHRRRESDGLDMDEAHDLGDGGLGSGALVARWAWERQQIEDDEHLKRGDDAD